MSNGSYEIVVEDGDSYNIVVETSQVGPRGPQGIPGPNTVTEETSTPLQGVLVADGERIREALPGEVVNAEAMQDAVDAALIPVYADLGSKANSVHSHAMSDISGLSDALSAKANQSHIHHISDVVGLTAILVLLRPVISSHPESQTAAFGGNVTFSVTAAVISNTHLTLAYQWQVSYDDGETWADITGAIASSYTTDTLGVDDATASWRCLVSNEFGLEISESASVMLPAFAMAFDSLGNTITPMDYTDGDGDWRAYTFAESGTLDVLVGGEFEYLLVAGGAAGGSASGFAANGAGGGGAGGLLAGVKELSRSVMPIVIGGGGIPGTGGNDGGKGSDSTAIGLTAIGGGGGGGGAGGKNGLTGGSGGGAGGGSGTPTGGIGLPGQGHSGGNKTGSTVRGAAGGGGAGAAGANTIVNENGSVGGTGLASSISGVSKYYAGGGGGGPRATGIALSLGGLGGGGASGGTNGSGVVLPVAGATNTGGGGGGGAGGQAGAAGGSGVFVVRFKYEAS